MTKKAFDYVLGEVKKDLADPKRSSDLSPTLKLAICLKFLAEGSYQQAVGKDFHLNVAQPTVSKVIKEVLQSLEKRLCSSLPTFSTFSYSSRGDKFTTEETRIFVLSRLGEFRKMTFRGSVI